MKDQPAPFDTSLRPRERNPVAAAYLAAAAMRALAEEHRHETSPNVRHQRSPRATQPAITPANRSTTTHGRVERMDVVGATAHVEAMIERGEAFADIEDYIDKAPGLTDDTRGALWLMAWAEAERPERRQVVLSMGLA